VSAQGGRQRSVVSPRPGFRVGRWLLAVGSMLAIWFGPAAASARADSCPSGQSLDCTYLGVVGLFGANQCPAGGPAAKTAAARLEDLIEQVPCPSSGRVSFDTADDAGAPMDVLDLVADPAGGYLGVYHIAVGPTDNALLYRVMLGRSTDLIHWHRVAELDRDGASMPTLRPIPGQPGFVLAYEKSGSSTAGHVVRVRYYATRDDLLANHYRAQRDLPLLFSPFNNGTPSILSVRWRGSLQRSVIQLGFHYETSRQGGAGPDREAVGTLRGFRRWSARPDAATDAALDRQGLAGNHGDWRQFSFESAWWRLYEAQTSFNDFSSWHVLLTGPGTGSMHALTLQTGGAKLASSFGNPVAQELPAPGGRGQVLVVTMFLFAATVPDQAGELVYYQPI
jgi:hypothetical protein